MPGAVDESFEIVPMAGGGTAPLIGALERLLVRVERLGHHAIVISEKSGFPYVQFLVGEGRGAYLEAVSNDYLLEQGRLSAEQDRALLALGWRHSGDPEHPVESRPRNYWLNWPARARLGDAAALAVISLVEVYGVSLSTPLKVRVLPGVRNRQAMGTSGGSGRRKSRLIVNVVREKSDDELSAWNRTLEQRVVDERAAGNGYSAWWTSKLLSTGLTEAERRRLSDAERR